MVISALLTIFLVILVHWLVFLYRRPPGLPPGPLPLPFIGSAWVFLLREDFKVFTELRQHYGGAVSIFSGCWLNGLVVIAFDWASIVELANNRNVADRPLHLNELRGVSEGIVWAQYDRAKRRRKFLTQALKTVGLSSTTTPGHIADEITRLFAYIDDQKNSEPFDPNDVITEAMTSCLLLKTYGHRFDLNDEACARLFAGGRKFFEATVFEMLMLPQLKFLRYFVRDKMADAERDMEATMTRWLRDEINKRRSVPESERQLDGPDLVDLYMLDSDSAFEDFNAFVRSLVDIFLGSMDTNAKSVCWVLFYLAHMPDEQERLFKEIESVVSSIDYPQIKHREQLNRLVAFIEESARYSCMASVGFPRRCEQSVSFRCVSSGEKEVFYTVPKNGTVWFSAYTNQYDDNYWLDPRNFRVERWLKPDDGKICPHTHLLPFGIGRRVCVGEQVARNLQFLFVSALIQRFTWRLADYVPFDGYRVGLTRIPPQHKLIFTRRD